MKLLDLPPDLRDRRMFGFFDDFEWYLSPHRWTSLSADAGTSVAAAATAVGGTVVLTTGAVDNSECALGTTVKLFRPADDKPLVFDARLQYAEAAVNAANLFAGFADVLTTADLLQDNGNGPKASFFGAGLFKVDGDSAWRCVSARGALQTVTAGVASAGGPAPQTVRVEIQPVDATNAEVTFYVDDLPLRDLAGLPVKHTLTLTGFASLQAGVFAKAGSATSETISVDYIAAYQLR
ncbi:MAG: hypothetical protein EHM42_04065 [Planctomycetaceae bacterium]|nr:MAG: hypothetical protein EHM42_04065 [Planctomycetaceae bacterium]